MYRIALCGAHGTGKSTLLKELQKEFPELTVLEKTLRPLWESFGVTDFEKLPADVRSVFQRHILLRQIEREDAAINGFLTDRSVLDYLGYARISSNMIDSELKIYELLIKERLKNYTHLIYLPVEFPAQVEYLRANPENQQQVATILEDYLKQWLKPEQYLRVAGSVEERLQQIKEFIKIL